MALSARIQNLTPNLADFESMFCNMAVLPFVATKLFLPWGVVNLEQSINKVKPWFEAVMWSVKKIHKCTGVIIFLRKKKSIP